MNEDTLRTADSWRTRGDEVALATVVRTRRSAPRPLGSKFAVGARGEMAGSVSGGCVEGAVVAEAQSVLKGGPPKLVFYGIANDEARSGSGSSATRAGRSRPSAPPASRSSTATTPVRTRS
jgi:xanthine dehydrogenase accessory factor